MTRAGDSEFRVGTSGYQYDHWRGPFYPRDLPKGDWLDYYAEAFNTVEINNTFYHLPRAGTFDSWRESVENGFLYALKFSRYGSHLKKLKAPDDTIGAFLERAEHLGPHLGPILVQLPPHWHVNAERLSAFLDAAPERCRWALEFRDPSWLCEAVYDILRAHNAALVIHDMIEDHPRQITADWLYLRFHGANDGGDYPYQALSAEAQRIERYLADGLDVYAYFNNDARAYAVKNARDLRRYVAGE